VQFTANLPKGVIVLETTKYSTRITLSVPRYEARSPKYKLPHSNRLDETLCTEIQKQGSSKQSKGNTIGNKSVLILISL
jgi:hypothetical protein